MIIVVNKNIYVWCAQVKNEPQETRTLCIYSLRVSTDVNRSCDSFRKPMVMRLPKNLEWTKKEKKSVMRHMYCTETSIEEDDKQGGYKETCMSCPVPSLWFSRWGLRTGVQRDVSFENDLWYARTFR
jgi:hypothetical protein